MSQDEKETPAPSTRSKSAFLIEEGVKWFKTLYDASVSSGLIPSPSDKVALLLHSFMLEIGFNNFTNCERSVLPDNWRGPAGYISKFRHRDTDPMIILTVTSLGPLLKVHGTNTVTGETFSSSSIKPSLYLRGESLTNIGNLARSFKNEVGTPLLNSVRQDLGLQVSGLPGLPPELLLRVFQSLNLKGVMALSRVSKHLRDIHKLDNIWRKLYCADFGSSRNGRPEDEDWYISYKEEYLRRKRLEDEDRRLRQSPRPPMFPYPDFSSDPDAPDPFHPEVPGIVGGDYDRFPGGLGPGVGPNLRLPRPRFDPPGPNFPQGPRRGRGRGGFGPPGFFGGGGFGGFM